MSDVLALATDLLARPSPTPDDAGCQDVLAARLAAAGFACERMRFGEVDNLWARHGAGEPVLCCVGHTDVVPAGPVERWTSDPFHPQIRDGRLFARGAADMKGPLAAMVVAAERFVAATPRHGGSLAFLVTSDEEALAVDGTARVVAALAARGQRIAWAVVGEPTSDAAVADTVKNGRRGSLSGRLRVRGRQGHSAYPHLADNAVHKILPVLQALVAREWDRGNADFPPTALQIVGVGAGTGASNVIPGECDVLFNIRYATEWTADRLQAEIAGTLRAAGLAESCDLQWNPAAEPYLTRGPDLERVIGAVAAVTGRRPRLSTSGGTSDGRFMPRLGAQVFEIGPPNATIHQVDENIDVADLSVLAAVYERIFATLLPPAPA